MMPLPLLSHCLGLPEVAYAVLPGSCELIAIKRGEAGYRQMYDGSVTGKAARLFADKLNQAACCTPAQREAMLYGSLFGWSIPAARPETWASSARTYAETKSGVLSQPKPITRKLYDASR